jgi:hypothetical protein
MTDYSRDVYRAHVSNGEELARLLVLANRLKLDGRSGDITIEFTKGTGTPDEASFYIDGWTFRIVSTPARPWFSILGWDCGEVPQVS